MRHSQAVYRGERLLDSHGRLRGKAVSVDGESLTLPPALHMGCGFEWGYGGAGPKQLALALVLDATGNQDLAIDTYKWFMWCKVACWGATWSITAGEIRQWVGQALHEQGLEHGDDADRPVCGRIGPVRRCHECGCTDDDCRQCIALTGLPCHWVEGQPDLCSRCDAEMHGDLPAGVTRIFQALAREGGAE